MIKISKIIETMNLLDDNLLFKQSDIIYEALIKTSDFPSYEPDGWWDHSPEEGEYDSFDDPYSEEYDQDLEQEEMLELQKSVARDDLIHLLAKEPKTLEDREEIAQIIAFLSDKPYQQDPETLRFKELLGDPSLYTSSYETNF